MQGGRPHSAPFQWNHRWPLLALAASALVSAVAQLALRADPLLLVLALLGIGIGLFGFALAGPRDLGSWTLFFYVLGNGLVALYAKTLFAQPLESNLDAPLLALSLIDIGCFSLLLALFFAKKLPVGRPILRPQLDPGFLRFLSWASYFLASVFWLLNRQFLDPDGSGFGGFALFVGLFLMAVIARTAYRSLSQLPSTLDPILILMIVTGVIAGLIDNTKTGVALPAVSFFVTVLFFRGRLSRVLIIGSIIAAMIFASVIGPLTHIYRAFDIQELSLHDRVQLLSVEGSRMLHGEVFREYDQLGADQFTEGYYDYFGGGKGQMIVGRYASIQQIDPIVNGVSRFNPLGGAVVWRGLAHSLPKFIYPDKPQETESYDIVVSLGLIDASGGKYPTVPLVAQAFAAYGFNGVLFIPFLTFLFFLLATKKVGWDLERNVYAIFFFCQFLVVYANQGDFSQYTGEVLRGFPVFVGVFLVLERLYQIVTRRSLRAPARAIVELARPGLRTVRHFPE